MIGPLTTEQTDSSRRSAPSPRGTAPQSIDGPATVLKSAGGNPPRSSPGTIPGEIDSELHRRLFPSDSSPGDSLAPPDVSGCRLEHFRIEEMIGRGGMGAVFRAYDERLDRVVALKVLSPSFSREPATVERFRNEAKSAARLDHENVARVYSSGEDRGMNFIAFEFVTGTNLRDLIRENGRLSPEETVNYTLQIAAALRHTSAAGVVHRDIKPSNIIIAPSGRAKLVDLGLARKESSESSPDLTVAGTTLGTFDYISPEQAKDPRNVDIRSDIYSLGCTVYHMLTGEPPYPDGTILQKLLDRQDKTPPDPALKSLRVPPSLSAVVQKMMASRPGMRHASADDLINDLLLIAEQFGLRGVHPEGLVWAHASRLHRSRFLERNLGWIVTAAILGLVVFAVDRFSRVGDKPPSSLAASAVGARTPGAGATDSSGDPADTQKPATPRKPAGTAATSGAQEQTGPGGIAQPNAITYQQQLDPEFLQKLTAGTGLLGSIGIATSSGTHDNFAVPRRTLTADNDSRSAAKTGSSKSGTSSPATAANAEEPPPAISIFGRTDSFTSLEAACATATSGQVIVLNFDGQRKDADGKPVADRPIRIADKRITIRAADGRHPVLVFSGEDVPSRGAQTRMVTVSTGTLSVFGVGFRMKVNDRVDAENDARWSVFALQGFDQIHLKYVNVTVDNPLGRTASIFEIVQKSGPDLARMKMMKKSDSMAADRFEITVYESFLRGECDVLSVAFSRPGVFDVDRTVVVAGESLLSVVADGSGESVADRVELKLVHVTCVAGNAAIRIAAGETPASVLPVQVWSQDNLFAASGRKPLVQVSGAGQVSDLQRLLTWKGEKNFYSGFEFMWKTTPDAGTPDSKLFEDWKTHWANKELDASDTGVAWKRDWSSKAIGTILPADLELDAPSNPAAISAANSAADGFAVGADVSAVARRMGIKTKPVPTP